MAETGGVALANEMLKLIELHDASNIAAVIVEPVSGSAGAIIPPQGYYNVCVKSVTNTISC